MTAQAKRIVVGFDGSNGARRALDKATRLMGYGSTMIVVNVGPADEPASQRMLGVARAALLDRLVAASYVTRTGDPADELVIAANELDADLIVVGRRGPDGRDDRGPGSVSAEVLRRATCDVLVVG
jgi:nucleotide-binding universal stress UspA family protein